MRVMIKQFFPFYFFGKQNLRYGISSALYSLFHLYIQFNSIPLEQEEDLPPVSANRGVCIFISTLLYPIPK